MPMVCFHVVCSSDALTLPTWLFVSILGPRSGFEGFLGIQNIKKNISLGSGSVFPTILALFFKVCHFHDNNKLLL